MRASALHRLRRMKNAVSIKKASSSVVMLGRALAALDAQVDAVISSRSALRDRVAGRQASEGATSEPALRPQASFADFRKMLDKYAKHEAIMVVGHNPNLSQFLGELSVPSQLRIRWD